VPETVLHPKIRSLREMPRTPNLLIFGEQGTGKTTFAATAPKPLFLSVEAGLDSVRDMPDLSVWPIHTLADISEAYTYLSSSKHPFESVVLDSLSELYYGPILEYALNYENRSTKEDPDIAGLRDYGRMGNITMEVIRQFKGLPMNTIFIAGEKEVSDDGRLIKSIQLAGNVGKAAPYQFDLVAYTYVKTPSALQAQEQPRYFMRIKPHERGVAKSRLPKSWAEHLPSDIEDPTWERLTYALDEAQRQAEKTVKSVSVEKKGA